MGDRRPGCLLVPHGCSGCTLVESLLPHHPRWYLYSYIVDVERHIIISMVIMCNVIAIIEHDGRRPGLSNAPVVIEQRNLKP